MFLYSRIINQIKIETVKAIDYNTNYKENQSTVPKKLGSGYPPKSVRF